MIKLTFPCLGAFIGIAGAMLGLTPVWAIAPLGAGGLLAWGVVEYLADRPVHVMGDKVKRT